MPNMNGMGPYGAGPGTGRGMGPCCGTLAAGFANGRGRGFGRGSGFGGGLGYGRSSGFGWGPGRGWAAVGYDPGSGEAVSSHMRTALEERKAFLRAELARTEDLLAGSSEEGSGSGAPVK